MCVTAMVPGLNYFSLAQSHQVLEGKENFYDDYGCGVAVPVVGTVGAVTTTTSMTAVATATLFAIIAVATSAGAGAEAAVMGAIAAIVGSGVVAFAGIGCMVAPCGQMCMMRTKLIEEQKLSTCCGCPAGVETCCCVFWCFPCIQCQIQRQMQSMREKGGSTMHETGAIYLFAPETTNSTEEKKE